jgi:hypothetical protein
MHKNSPKFIPLDGQHVAERTEQKYMATQLDDGQWVRE